MNKDLIGFLIKAKKSGYASYSNQIKEADGSFSTRFEEGDFKFHDNFFGGEPFAGREVVWYKNKPYWMVVYYGADTTGKEEAIPTLTKALSNMPDDFPTRGPKKLTNGEFEYENKWTGDIEKFYGEETIGKKGKQIYKANYMGGLVNLRNG
jgi:hypothetical protein